MSLRRWTDALGPPLFAAAAVVTLVAPAVAVPAHPRTNEPAPIAAVSPLAGALPTCSQSPRSATSEDSTVNAAAWYRLDPVLSTSATLDGQRLLVGQVGRPGALELPLAVESFASGPSGGRILVGDDDGRRSIVRDLDVGRRCAVVVHEGRELIRRAVFDPSGSGIVEFRLDRSTRADLGVWSRPGAGSKPVRLLDPLPPNDRIGRVFTTELAWSIDGTRLVVTSCGESSCIARVLDRSNGLITTVDEPRVGQVLGLVGNDLVAYGGCPSLPCEIVAMDLPTGRIRILAALAGLGAVLPTKGGAVVFEDYLAPGRLGVVGVDGTAPRTLPLGDGLRLVPAPDRALAAIELPAGVIALSESGRPSGSGDAATFINLADGREMPAAEVVR